MTADRMWSVGGAGNEHPECLGLEVGWVSLSMSLALEGVQQSGLAPGQSLGIRVGGVPRQRQVEAMPWSSGLQSKRPLVSRCDWQELGGICGEGSSGEGQCSEWQIGAGRAGSRLHESKEGTLSWAGEGFASVSGFKAFELFQWEGPPPGKERKGALAQGGNGGLPGKQGQVRLTGQGGPHRQVQSGRVSQVAAVVGLGEPQWLEGQWPQDRASGPYRDSSKGSQLVSSLPHPFSLARPLPAAPAISRGLEQALSTSSWPGSGAGIAWTCDRPQGP